MTDSPAQYQAFEDERIHAAVEARTAALRQASERKDRFLAVLAHELRNPLAAIASAVSLLRTEDAEERGWAADMIERQTRQLTRLIEDVLEVARLENGKLRWRRELLDCATVLDRAIETVRPTIASSPHKLTSEYHRELFVEGDAARLEQVVVNLLGNAAKYTPPGGHLCLRARRENGDIVVEVQDDGLGISPEKLPDIFEPFAQASRLLATMDSGLGLGLTIVRELVELQGGSVSATSAGEGRGSTFTVRLPSAETPLPALPREKEPSATHTSARILVVDDHQNSAEALARLLARYGHQVATAADGLAALESSGRFEPDAVILDLDLPKMDGYEVASRLRRAPAHRHCLIIGLSGYQQDHRRRSEAGFDHHFTKPVEVTALRDVIEGSLAKRPSSSSEDSR